MLKPVEQYRHAGNTFTTLEQRVASKWSWLVTLGVLILAALPRLTSLQAFLTNDETLYWEWSHRFFLALLEGNWPGTIVGPGNPSLTIFWSHTLVMGLKYSWAWLNGVQATALATWPDFQPDATLPLLVERRWPIVLFNTLAVVLAYRLLDKLSGRRVALLAAVLLALDPFYLADSRTSRGEGLMASLVLLTLLSYLAYWLLARPRYLVFSGVLAGLALLTKISAVSLVIWVVVVTPFLIWHRSHALARRQFQTMFMAWLGWGVLAVATFWLLWPAMWVSPAQALGFVFDFVSDVGVSGRENYFFNQVYTDELLPLFYPVVYILRVTPLALLGLLAAFAYLYKTYSRPSEPDSSKEEPGQPLLTILLLAFGLIYGVLMTVGTLKRDWYILPVFPALDIVAAVGLVWLGRWIWRRWLDRCLAGVSAPMAWSGSLAAVLILQGVTILPSHPYYYTYWNPLVLGDHWAANAVRVGWDLDLSAGADYLNRKPNAEQLRVATHSTRGFQQIFNGQTIRWVPEQPWIQADYLIVRRNHLQREKLPAYVLDYVPHLKLDHVVTIEGVDYLWIYEGPRAEYFAGPSMLTGKAMLMGYDLETTEVGAGETLGAKFYWQNQGMTADDDFFLQLVDANDYVWSEAVATPLPGFEAAALTHEQVVESQVNLTIPVGTPPGIYFLRSGVYSRVRQETLGTFTLAEGGDRITVTRSTQPAVATEAPVTYRLDVELSPEVSLLGFDLPGDTLLLSSPSWLTLYWQAGPTITKDYVIGLQLLDASGQEAAYWLGRPVLSGYPTNEWLPGEMVRDPWRLEIPAEVSPGDYSLQVTLFDPETEAKTDPVTLGPVTVLKRLQQFTIPAMQKQVKAQLGERMMLLGYDLSTEPITGGGRLRLTLYWQAQQIIETSYTVFVHLLDANGIVVAQHDGLPAAGAIPTSDWEINEVVTDRHLVEFLQLPPGEYQLVAGMYDPTTGTRLPASGDQTVVRLQTFSVN